MNPDPSVIEKYGLLPQHYFMLMARMEPENNIEMIIRGHLASNSLFPLLVIGNIDNQFGRYITSKYNDPRIKYCGSIYDKNELDNLRYYSALYFHGHSVGGTNPSLIEAMACGCLVAAHDNRFNKAVLNGEAGYFSTDKDVQSFIEHHLSLTSLHHWKRTNMEKVRTVYNQDRIVDSYEKMMLNACGQEQAIVPLAVAEAV
jgi:glycosyltransferase involved in cell wall biosynthesis